MAGPTPLMKKLRLDRAMRALIVNPPDGFEEALGVPFSTLNLSQEFEEHLEFVLVFASFQQEITQRMPEIKKSLVEDGLLWLAYPKKSAKKASDLSRDVFWDLIRGYGFRPVTQISIDPVWSGLRFRPEHLVGK